MIKNRRRKMKKKKKILATTLAVATLGTVVYMVYAYSAVQQLRKDLQEDIKNMKKEKEI